jgi:membrane-associated phospholipid phosphatase
MVNKLRFKMKKLILYILLLIPIPIFSQNIDVDILKHINSQETYKSDSFFRFMSNSEIYVIGAVPVGMATVGLIDRDKTTLKNAGCIAISSAVNLGITAILKYTVKRQRPFRTYPGIIFNKSSKPINDPSFPSGHTSTSFNTATSLSLMYSKWYIIVPSYVWAGTVAYSRMDLGVHYPSDVLVGTLIGFESSYVIYKKLK